MTARATILFFAAYSLNLTLHELAHALAAYALGVHATLFHFYVDIPQEHATMTQRMWIGVVGPCASLIVGLVCWLVSRSLRGRPHELTFLYLGVFGVSIFLGNLFSVAFVGDFSRVTREFEIPMPLRYAIALAAAVALCAFTYRVGKELARLAPGEAGVFEAVTRLVVVPVIAGTTLVLLAYIPMPSTFVMGWISPSMFWIFAAIGVARASKGSPTLPWGGPVRKADVALAIIALVAVRIMTRGVPFMP